MWAHHLGNPNYADLSALRTPRPRRVNRTKKVAAKMRRTEAKELQAKESRA
jgi:hypothetical protein